MRRRRLSQNGQLVDGRWQGGGGGGQAGRGATRAECEPLLNKGKDVHAGDTRREERRPAHGPDTGGGGGGGAKTEPKIRPAHFGPLWDTWLCGAGRVHNMRELKTQRVPPECAANCALPKPPSQEP
eukprot:8035680-Pyramimonas_sp.AAC.1